MLILTINHSSPCTTRPIRVFLNSSCFSGNWNGRESGLPLDYSLRFPKVGNGSGTLFISLVCSRVAFCQPSIKPRLDWIGNEVMGMGGNGYTKVIPAHL